MTQPQRYWRERHDLRPFDPQRHVMDRKAALECSTPAEGLLSEKEKSYDKTLQLDLLASSISMQNGRRNIQLYGVARRAI